MDMFGLINMNGRMYDPILGRMLSPDPYVPDGTYTQDFNRYTYARNNPLSYIDPDGESVLLATVLFAGWLNLAMNAHKADNVWQGLGYFAVGAGAAALGAGVGQVVAGAVGTIGFVGGALTGAAGGFAGGLVSGTGNAWLGGANFGDGLMSGLQTGAIGGLTGGLIGGISGGIHAARHGGNFWTGKGTTFHSAATPVDGYTVKIGEGMEYSTKYAKSVSDKHFGPIKKLDNLHADGRIAEGTTRKGDFVFDKKGRSLAGSTVYNGAGKGSDVFLYQAAFTSKEQLYLTLGHEYIHVYFNAKGYNGAKASSEVAAYRWEIAQLEAWNMSTLHAQKMLREYYKRGMLELYYRDAGIPIRPKRPW
jgi:RHS repeat-associated protein